MVLVVIDATQGVTEQDAKVAGIAHERGKGVIIVVNKWDAIEKNDKTMREYENEVRRVLSFMPYAEIMYVSAVIWSLRIRHCVLQQGYLMRF